MALTAPAKAECSVFVVGVVSVVAARRGAEDARHRRFHDVASVNKTASRSGTNTRRVINRTTVSISLEPNSLAR
jgi:hypothetical protein